jgi:hypothetical protein
LYILFIFFYNEVIAITYCLDEETAKKLIETAVKTRTESANTINPTASNNIDVHIHNPNIHLVNNIGKAMSNLGAGGAVSAGIYALSKSKKFIGAPAGIKAGYVALGGILGGGAFVATNFANSYAQNRLSSDNNNFNNKDNNSYDKANSIIEEGDGADDIMYFLYNNLFLSICILFLLTILLYLYINYRRRELYLFII